MRDPDDGFESRIGIVDLVDKRILHLRGQCGVKSGCRFFTNSQLNHTENVSE